MRICVLQSSYKDADHMLEAVDSILNLSPYSKHHAFENHLIAKSTAREDIDAAVAKSYDFYFNFLWGQLEDNVAGIRAIEYFESLKLPHIGQPSRVLHKSKAEFYAAAQRIGYPRVPGNTAFPLFVKPAIGCASMFIDQNSICHNETELKAAISRLSEQLEPRRRTRQKALSFGHSNGLAGEETGGLQRNGDATSGETPSDIVVQEFIEGQDYSCVVIEHYKTPIALTPTVYLYPESTPKHQRFLTWEMKWNKDLKVELLHGDADVLEALQKTALEAFEVTEMSGASWCNVDMKIPKDGKPVVLEVNPMPGIFLSGEWEDKVIEKCIPGGHQALIDIIIATSKLQQNTTEKIEEFRASAYDGVMPVYDSWTGDISGVSKLIAAAIAKWDFKGSVLDAGAGTGLFGRILRVVVAKQKGDSLTGIDLSPKMVHRCEESGFYDRVYQGTLQTIVPSLTDYDHFVMFSVAYFLSPEDFSLVLSCAFRVAQKSVTLCIDEITDAYNDGLKKKGEPYSFMVGHNHLQHMDDFGLPKGWKLTERFSQWGWNSPSTGHPIQVTVFRFERL